MSPASASIVASVGALASLVVAVCWLVAAEERVLVEPNAKLAVLDRAFLHGDVVARRRPVHGRAPVGGARKHRHALGRCRGPARLCCVRGAGSVFWISSTTFSG